MLPNSAILKNRHDWILTNQRQNGRYIMLSMEAPIYLKEYRDLSSLPFNWTMTYRRDSDFPIPYAWIEPTGVPLPGPPGSARLQR